MSRKPIWPGGARGALSLTFDNLGEAAELELGAIEPGTPLGGHFTATEVLPKLLEQLEQRRIAATFFVEGLNTEIYPDELTAIDAAGHELAYHAWRHEDWAGLSPREQARNLSRGLAGFESLGVQLAGLRPPGGRLGREGTEVLSEAGLRYGSPAGEGVGAADGVALLPFQWRHLDASCVLPPLAAAREQMAGSTDPVDPALFLASLERAIENLSRTGGYISIVLHPFMLGWLGDERLAALLDHIAASRGDELWVARCADVAEHVLADPKQFRYGTILDSAGWT